MKFCPTPTYQDVVREPLGTKRHEQQELLPEHNVQTRSKNRRHARVPHGNTGFTSSTPCGWPNNRSRCSYGFDRWYARCSNGRYVCLRWTAGFDRARICWCDDRWQASSEDGRYVRAWWEHRGGLSDRFDRGSEPRGAAGSSCRDHLEHHVAKCKTAGPTWATGCRETAKRKHAGGGDDGYGVRSELLFLRAMW